MNRVLALLAMMAVLTVACAHAAIPSGEAGPAPAATATPTPTRLVIATPIVETRAPDEGTSADGRPGDPPPPEIVATAEALFGEGGIYVAHLVRPGDVPAGWRMDRAPNYAARVPEPGSTYRFACAELPARSSGVASVGYRNLEGLPSITVEYVIYPTEDAAVAALADMQTAAETCGDFELEVAGGVAAGIMPISFTPIGDASFAAALATSSGATGDLLTHLVKVRQGHVVIGVNHTTRAGEPEPDRAITEAVARLAVDYVAGIE